MMDAPAADNRDADAEAREEAKAVANPRLIDGFRLGFNQDDVPFAVPHLKEDLPFAVEPFPLWNSADESRRELHSHLMSYLAPVLRLDLSGQRYEAIELQLGCAEAKELGLEFTRGIKAGEA